MSQVHPQARTTPLIRAEIKAATGSQGELAARYNISVATLRKWQNRDQAQDRSHRPHKLSTTLHGGGRRLRRCDRRSGQLGAHQGLQLMPPLP